MFKRGDPHPEDPTKVFLRYRKNDKGETVEQWTRPEVVQNRRQYAKDLYAKYTDREKKRGLEYRQQHREKELERYRRYNSSERRRRLEKKAYWEDPDKYRQRKIQQYYRRKRNVIPLLAQHQEALSEIYRLCAELNYAATSVGATEAFEVDHIWPLCHKDFCGLHAPWNLQILTRHENACKSNKRPDRKE